MSDWHKGSVLTPVADMPSGTWMRDEQGNLHIKASTLFVESDYAQFEKAVWSHVADNYSEKAVHKISNMLAHKYEISSVNMGVVVHRGDDKYIITPNGEIYQLVKRV